MQVPALEQGEVNLELVSSRVDEPDAVLRERLRQHGYLFFRSFADAPACEALLRDIVAASQPQLSLDDDTGLPRLEGEPFFETDPAWDDVYPRIQALESFHGFFHTPRLLGLMARVVNAEPFVYPMKMARISTPGRIGCETPPHQDAHSHQAGPTMAGIWVALHDVPAELGRLKVLARSHQRGVRPVFQAAGVGGIQCEIYGDETEWHVSDYRRGDVLIFHSCAVHKAEPNLATDTARISVDTRFCDFGAPVFRTNIEPHHGWRIPGLDWERIYAGWSGETPRYYWRDYPALWGPTASEIG